MKYDALGNRMKKYESISVHYLPKRIPVIIRIDGKAFHTLTRKHWKRAWSEDFFNIMVNVAKKVQKEIQGCNLCYCQSDEINFLLTDYKTIKTDAWFDYNINKMVSVSASIASAIFSLELKEPVYFDSRCFSIPMDDVTNYFIWREQDATRNSIQYAGQENYSQKQLHGKSCNEIQEMLFQKGINWNDYLAVRKRGFCIVNNELDTEIPIFTQDRNYIDKFVNIRED